MEFPQEKGTFQGSPLSPLLCVLFLTDLILYVAGDEASAFHGTKLPWSKETIQDVIRLLLFADDIVLVADDVAQLQIALDLLAVWAEKRGLRFSHGKCKAMQLARRPSDKRTREELEPVHQSPDLLVLCVNTTRAWRHKNGEVSAAQVDRVAKLLTAASPGQLRVVVVHQPAAVTQVLDRPNLLRGRDAAVQVGSAAGADLVMGGHIHLPYTLAQHGLARRLWVVQAGTAVSSRIRLEAPNSVNILRWGASSGVRGERARAGAEAGEGCLIEQWDFARHEQVFVRTAVTAVDPERA